jgi:DnaJ-class molecular chaperone
MKAKTCKHEPSDVIAAFCHVCKHCREWIEAVACAKCDGAGWVDYSWVECRKCNGAGVKKWRKAL